MALAEQLRAARKASGLTQQDVSQRSSIDDSSLSAFENGRVEPRLAQLQRLAEVYHLPLSYFFQDSPMPAQTVMWRNRPANCKEVEGRFLELCRWYRQLENWTGEVIENGLPTLDGDVSQGFWYPDVIALAESARRCMGLGDRPGESLFWILQEVCGVKIFHMDLGDAGVAACAHSSEFGYALLLNANCSRWRRNHDLAHELFHLLTWVRFRHADGVCEPTDQEEKFATCFAGNLLLPAASVKTALDKITDQEGRASFAKLDEIARQFDVSLESLLWRMHFLYNLNDGVTEENVKRAKVYIVTTPRKQGPPPSLRPERYRSLAIRALQDGEISLGRFVKLMEISRKEAVQYVTEGRPGYAEATVSVA